MRVRIELAHDPVQLCSSSWAALPWTGQFASGAASMPAGSNSSALVSWRIIWHVQPSWIASVVPGDGTE